MPQRLKSRLSASDPLADIHNAPVAPRKRAFDYGSITALIGWEADSCLLTESDNSRNVAASLARANPAASASSSFVNPSGLGFELNFFPARRLFFHQSQTFA